MDKPEVTQVFAGNDSCGPIEVWDRGDCRTMYFGTPFPQSTMLLKDPYELILEYSRVAMLSLLFLPMPRRVLVLGLGGGSIPKFFWKYFPDCVIDSVECRELVIQAAREYFSLPKNGRFRVFVDFAERFILKNSDEYDLLFVDLFDGDAGSNLVADMNFCQQCFERTKPGGVVIMNVWGSITQEHMMRCVLAVHAAFSNNVLILPVKGTTNLLFFLFKPPLPVITGKDLDQRAEYAKKNYALNLPSLLEKVQRFKDKGFVFQGAMES